MTELQSSEDQSAAPQSLECDFFMYLFKVQPCPKRGAHDWSSCPYAHPKEKARRRDPRVYKYASSPCPESLQGVNCGRGVDCPYAHSVYEYWLHPARFRTQMCKKGAQCNRTLCFFAHSAAELRFPDTEDDVEAAAVDAAAASVTAGSLHLCHTALPSGSGVLQSQPGLVRLPAGGGCSSVFFNTGSVCSDASIGSVAIGRLEGSTGSYNMAALQAAAGNVPHGSCSSQVAGFVEDMSGSFGNSDPGLFIQGLVGQQQQQQQQQHQSVQGVANSISEPLPRLGNDASMLNARAWLQLATASQLPASQILSSIQSPSIATLAAQPIRQPLHHQQLVAQAAGRVGMPRQQPVAGLPVHSPDVSSGSLLVAGGSRSASHSLLGSHVDSSAAQLVAGMNGLQLQGNLVDGHSSSLPASSVVLNDPYASLNAAVAGLHMDPAMLCITGVAAAPPEIPAQVLSSSRAEDFRLLQLLQDKQGQQQPSQHMGSSHGPPMLGLSGMHPQHTFSTSSVVPPVQDKLAWG